MSKPANQPPNDSAPVPRFATVSDEAKYWDTHSTTEHESAFQDVDDVQFVVRKPASQHVITIHLSGEALERLTDQAHSRGIDVSSLTEEWILERLGSSA